MKNILLILLLLPVVLLSQEDSANRGTITIQRQGQIARILFDDVNYRLIGIDQYGNILDSAVTEFRISVTIKGIFYSDTVAGPALSFRMQQLLGTCDRTTVIFFDNIKARDRMGALADMPAIRYTFAYRDENND